MLNFPFFGRPTAFAIDISDLCLRLLELKTTRHQLTASAFNRMDIPEGVMEHGTIRDQQALADVILKAYEKAAPRPPLSKNVAAELPEAQTFLHHLALPRELKGEALSQEVMRQVGTTMPFSLAEMAWDFQTQRTDDKNQYILFAAAPAEVVTAYEHTVALAGLRLVSLEPESLALLRAAAPLDKIGPNEILALVDFSAHEINLIFADRSGILLSQTLFEGGQALSQAISKKLHLNGEAAERAKREKGFGDKAVAEVAEAYFTKLLEEFRRGYAFVAKTYGGTLGRILLSGGTAQMPGLNEYLQRELKVEVADAEPEIDVTQAKPSELVSVTGSALRASRAMPGINFIVPAE